MVAASDTPHVGSSKVFDVFSGVVLALSAMLSVQHDASLRRLAVVAGSTVEMVPVVSCWEL